MTRLVILAAAILAGHAPSNTMDGEAIGRFVLQLVGLLLTGFLFYMALRDVTVNDVTRRRRLSRKTVA